MFIKLFVISILVAETVSLMCYQCTDTSADSGKSRCSKWVRTMNRYRQRYLETGRVDLPYVKNCSGFSNLQDADIYCSIMKVELGGTVRTYMRGCSDGKDFFSADYNSDVNKYVINDNQTYCVYTGQGYVACAQICQDDFCNGFVSTATDVTSSTLLLLVSVIVIALQRYFNHNLNG